MWADIPGLLGTVALIAAGVSLLLAAFDTAKWLEQRTTTRQRLTRP